MGQITTKDIISVLPSLSNDELLKVKETATFLASSVNTSKFEEYEWVYDAVNMELTAQGIRRYMPYGTFLTTSNFKKFRQGSSEVVAFFDDIYPNYKRREQKLAICRLLISHLITNMRSNGIPITLNTIINNIHRLPEIFEIAFPGYIKSGLAHLIPTQMERLAHGRSR